VLIKKKIDDANEEKKKQTQAEKRKAKTTVFLGKPTMSRSQKPVGQKVEKKTNIMDSQTLDEMKYLDAEIFM
jgi:hypothetical protein